jgi:hypothetical protein
VDIFRLIADRKIEEAMQEGGFDRLEGEGRPLPEDDDPFPDPAQRMANRLLKNAGITPDWIAEGREIEREAARAAALPESERAALNRRIALFNLKAPRTAHKLPL